MKSPRKTTLCFLIIVTYSSQATLNLNLKSIVYPALLREQELAGEDPARQKRAVAVHPPPAPEFTVDIEVSFENASFLEPIRAYLNSLRFPVQGNDTDPATSILNIEVTTVCRPTRNEIWCSCETGYRWPQERCLPHLTCQEHDGSHAGSPCSCLKGLPPEGPFCQLQGGAVTLRMSVRLNVGFQEDLRNSSSALYRSYKTDLETAFWKGYSILPGFKLVTVTGFRPGSVVVAYEVTSTAAPLELMRKANEQVTQSLNQTYKLDSSSFHITYSSDYICRLTIDVFAYWSTKKVVVTPIRILAQENMKVMCDNNPVFLNCCSEITANWSKIEWKQEGSISIPGISETDTESGCSRYTLMADGTQCPSGSSGTTVAYTCEFFSAHGARGSKDIKVTFISVAKLTITPDPISVSEGQNFSIKCISDVSNYDEMYWNTSAGIRIYKRFYTTRRYPNRAESVLTVQTSTREWNGTYHCIFRYKNSYSVMAKDVTVHPLPLEPDIMVDPLEAAIPCTSSHHIKCCIEENEDYKVIFQTGSLSFPAVKEVIGKQVCYRHNFKANSVSCPENVDVFCHFINAANTSVRSPPMKLKLVPEENMTCHDPIIGVGEPGKVIQKLCRFSNIRRIPGSPIGGTVTYRCVGSQWKVKRNDCISAPINILLQLAEALIKSPSQDEKLPSYLKNLSISTDKAKLEVYAFPGSLGAIINILDLLSTVPTQVNSEMMMHFLSTVNVILSKTILNSWKMSQEQKTNQSSQLLDSVERFSRAFRSEDSIISQPNVQMKSMVIRSGLSTSYKQGFVFLDSDLWGNVSIDENELKYLQPESFIVTVAFPTLQSILDQDVQGKNFANSLVMTTTVSHKITTPFRISMTFKNNDPSGRVPLCVFWNFNLNNHTGGWDSSGCYVKEVTEDSVSCSCDHLTSFSILMSPDSPDPGSLLKILLDIISYIGLCFSILSLAACLAVEAVVWKSVTKNRTSSMRHICIVNIAASLLVADIWFMVAAAVHDHHFPLNETACVAATFFVHFFYLSVFFWMLTLGLMLFYRLVFILHDTSKSVQKAIAFSLGYGCPLVISTITVGATQPREVYTRKNACWLNWEDTKALLAFVIPALIIVVVNMTITVVVIAKILRPSIGDKPSKQEKSSLFQISKSIGVLTPLLGLTWGFGLATVFEGSNAVFHIVFTLLNAFQGLFILLFGCLWDQKVQGALLNKFSLSRWSSQHSKSTSLASSTPVFSMSSPISRRFNNLFGKTGTYNVSTPETTSSSLENTSSAYSLLN
uniref:Adhesion G protein-coupled receptor F5 n=1 Tax=Sus scrofa TaxID=9823 RepID=A0A8D1BTZ1_PIG